MRRSEQREHIFKLLFMTQFNSEEEMTEQVSLYFENLEELAEEEQALMKTKYDDILEKLQEIGTTDSPWLNLRCINLHTDSITKKSISLISPFSS